MVVFDFCHTIVRCNSTFSFMNFYASFNRFFALKYYSLCFISKILNKLNLITDTHLTKIRVYAFRNESLNEVLKCAQLFAEYLEEIELSVVLDRIECAQSEGRVIISSNSLDFILSMYFMRKDIPVDIVSSTLEVKLGKFTGAYDKYLLDEGKVKSLKYVYPDIVVKEFWTDDLDADKDLVEFASSVIYVNEDRIVKLK
jgi:hypothetical protein